MMLFTRFYTIALLFVCLFSPKNIHTMESGTETRAARQYVPALQVHNFVQ